MKLHEAHSSKVKTDLLLIFHITVDYLSDLLLWYRYCDIQCCFTVVTFINALKNISKYGDVTWRSDAVPKFKTPWSRPATSRCVAESCCESELSCRFAGEKTWRHQGWNSAEYNLKVYRRLGYINRLTCQRLEIRRLQSRSGFSQIQRLLTFKWSNRNKPSLLQLCFSSLTLPVGFLRDGITVWRLFHVIEEAERRRRTSGWNISLSNCPADGSCFLINSDSCFWQ